MYQNFVLSNIQQIVLKVFKLYQPQLKFCTAHTKLLTMEIHDTLKTKNPDSQMDTHMTDSHQRQHINGIPQ